jgi:hypothetical protein
MLPALVPALEGLYGVIDARVAAHARLARLSGRLDLLLSSAAAPPAAPAPSGARAVVRARAAVAAAARD